MISKIYILIAVLFVLTALPACNLLGFVGGNEEPAGETTTALPIERSEVEDRSVGPGVDLRDANGCLIARAAEISYGYLFVSTVEAGEYELEVNAPLLLSRVHSLLRERLQGAEEENVETIRINVDGGTVTYSDGKTLNLDVNEGAFVLHFSRGIRLKDLPAFCLTDAIERGESIASVRSNHLYFNQSN